MFNLICLVKDIVIYYLDSYILSGIGRTSLANISRIKIIGTGGQDTAHGPGPGPDQGKAQIVHRIPSSRLRTVAKPDTRTRSGTRPGRRKTQGTPPK